MPAGTNGEMIMGINGREWQTLGSIEDRLAGSDPMLASMLAIFTRLNSGEEMPAREKIKGRRERVLHSGGRLRSATVLRPAMLSLWLIVSAGLIATALVLSATGHGGCSQFIGTVCGG
jgi:hypothetical protein